MGPAAGQGALIAFRQGSNDPTPRREGACEAPLGTFTSAELDRGLRIQVPDAEGSRVVLIEAG